MLPTPITTDVTTTRPRVTAAAVSWRSLVRFPMNTGSDTSTTANTRNKRTVPPRLLKAYPRRWKTSPGSPWGSVFFSAMPSAIAASTWAVTTTASASPMLVTNPTHRASGSRGSGGGRMSSASTVASAAGSTGGGAGGGVGLPKLVGGGTGGVGGGGAGRGGGSRRRGRSGGRGRRLGGLVRALFGALVVAHGQYPLTYPSSGT